MPLTTKDAASAAVAYTYYNRTSGSTEYIGPDHSDLSNDRLVFTSKKPKQTAVSYGNRRSSMNLIGSQTVANPAGDNVMRDGKVEVLASVPVGQTFAQFKERISRIIGLLETDAVVEKLFITGQTDQD